MAESSRKDDHAGFGDESDEESNWYERIVRLGTTLMLQGDCLGTYRGHFEDLEDRPHAEN